MSIPVAPAAKSRRLRFGLRAGLGAIAAIALTFGLLDQAIREPYRAEQRAAAGFRRLGGYVHLVDDTQGWVAKYSNFGLFDIRVAAIVDLDHSRVTDADLVSLRSFHHFGMLSLADTTVGDAGIETLRGVVGERFVDLSRTRVTDTSAFFENDFRDQPLGLRLSGNRVANGRIFPRQLRVMCTLQELDLSESDADDQMLANFPSGLNLVKLDLSGTNVTDAGLDSLSRLENLRAVDLTGTKVTPEGVARLKDGWKGRRPLAVATGATRLSIAPYAPPRPK